MQFDGLNVVRTDSELECPLIDQQLRDGGANLTLLPDGISEQDLIAAAQDADILLMCYTPITRRVIEAATKLRGIVKYGVGIDAIDIPAAIEHNVAVVNVPEYAENTVAEGAFCLLLALQKRLLPINQAMQQQEWFWPSSSWLAGDISGKTLGLIGTGKIGRSMARMAGAGFGANILGYDPLVSEQEMHKAGIEKCADLHHMLAQCDFVSLHCVLNEQTDGLMGHAEFSAMQKGALFINVSRGALIDEAALLRAMDSGQLAGCALDVYRQEPLTKTNHELSALYGRDNVILLPHITFFTEEAMHRLEHETLQRCSELADRKPLLVKSADPRLLAQKQNVQFVP